MRKTSFESNDKIFIIFTTVKYDRHVTVMGSSHDGVTTLVRPSHPEFFFKFGSEKNLLKTFNSIHRW